MANDFLIVHISTSNGWRGGEQQAWYLIDHLHRMDQKQLVCCPVNSPLYKRCKNAGIRTLDLSTHSGWLYLQSYGIRRVFRHEKKPLLMHAHDARGHSLAFLINFLPGRNYPVVVSRRVDVRPHESNITRSKYQSPHVKKILCVSKAIAGIMRDYLGSDRKIEVVYSGVDIDRFSREPSGKLHREFDLEDTVKLVGNTSALADHKDYFTFLRVAEQVLGSNMGARFFIIGGDAGEGDRLREWVEQKRLQDGIIFTGHREDIDEIMPELDVFLFTSSSEGLGTTVLDALAAEVPVVATRVGGVSEMITHEQTGLLADAGDDIQLKEHVMRMLVDDHLRNRVTQNGLRVVKKFDKDRMAEHTFKIYLEVMK